MKPSDVAFPADMQLTGMPGGDQDVFASLPVALREGLRNAARVILIANNPAITAKDVQALNFDAGDVLVSFNTCIKADLLCPESINVFVHGFNAPDRYFFGLPYASSAQRLFKPLSNRCFTMLVGCVGQMCPLPDVAMYRDRIPLPPLWNYPVERAGGKRYAGPSTGFNALVLFDWLRGHAGYDYTLLTLGFSNEAGKFWGGHAWDYERAWLLQADVVTVGLPPRKWWKSLFRLK